MDLTEFLLARIADDEHRLDLPEFYEEDSARGPGWGNRSECPLCGAYQFSGTEPTTEEAWWDHAENVHQRARVLAECDAKRRIVNAEILREVGPASHYVSPAVHAAIAGRTATQVLRLLALPHADHPDYDPSWRP